jgi:hypothetical protein
MIGQRFWFEYHCWEDHQSSDAKLWYHSHQECTVVDDAESDGDKTQTFDERCIEGCQLLYRVRFDDGLVWSVFEDELLDSPEHFERSDPPTPV